MAQIQVNIPDEVLERVAAALDVDPTPDALGPAISRLVRQAVFNREQDAWNRVEAPLVKEQFGQRQQAEIARRRTELGL